MQVVSISLDLSIDRSLPSKVSGSARATGPRRQSFSVPGLCSPAAYGRSSQVAMAADQRRERLAWCPLGLKPGSGTYRPAVQHRG